MAKTGAPRRHRLLARGTGWVVVVLLAAWFLAAGCGGAEGRPAGGSGVARDVRTRAHDGEFVPSVETPTAPLRMQLRPPLQCSEGWLREVCVSLLTRRHAALPNNREMVDLDLRIR